MNTFAIRCLRVVLLVLAAVSVLVQVLLPGWAARMGTDVPEVDHLVVPYSAAAIAFIGCGQVALLAVWRLLSMVEGSVIFSDRALRWVDAIVACSAVATTLAAMVLCHMLFFFPVPGGPGPAALLVGITVAAGVTFLLFMVVMRSLLASAVADRTELDAVV